MGKDNKENSSYSCSSFLKKRAPIYLGLIGLFAIFVVPIFTEKTLENSLPSLEDEHQYAVDLLKSYKGSNDRGMTVIQVISDNLADKYTDENIYENEKTRIELSISDENSPVYKITINFESYKGELEYIWNVNINSNEIEAISSDAKQISNIVDYYD